MILSKYGSKLQFRYAAFNQYKYSATLYALSEISPSELGLITPLLEWMIALQNEISKVRDTDKIKTFHAWKNFGVEFLCG